MLQQVQEYRYPSLRTENLLYIWQRLFLRFLRDKIFHMPSEERKDFEASMPRKV